jgi:hypothetical protein
VGKMAEDPNQRHRRLQRAWTEWSSELIPAPLLHELEAAANEVCLSTPRLAAEVLECYCASRRLPRVPPGKVPDPAYVRRAGGDGESEDHDFPFPAETFRVQLR